LGVSGEFVELYFNPPERRLLLCVDEKSRKISWLAFACLFGGALFGDASSTHSARAAFDLTADSKDVVKLATRRSFSSVQAKSL
jgi:hypothetical protein